MVNAADNKVRDASMDTIKIDIDPEKNEIKVTNRRKLHRNLIIAQELKVFFFFRYSTMEKEFQLFNTKKRKCLCQP